MGGSGGIFELQKGGFNTFLIFLNLSSFLNGTVRKLMLVLITSKREKTTDLVVHGPLVCGVKSKQSLKRTGYPNIADG